MRRKLFYLITILLISTLIVYLALLVNCYLFIPDCSGPLHPSNYDITATYIEMANATTGAYIRQTQAALTPTPIS